MNKQGSRADAALAVAGGALDGTPAAAADTGQLILPLSLDSFAQFESFPRALGDPAVRASLADNTTLPVSARQLVRMVNDCQFVSHTHEVLAAFDQWVRGQQSEDRLRATAGTLRSYVTSTYRAALDALATYSKSAYPQYSVQIESLSQRLSTISQGAAPCNPVGPTSTQRRSLGHWMAGSKHLVRDGNLRSRRQLWCLFERRRCRVRRRRDRGRYRAGGSSGLMLARAPDDLLKMSLHVEGPERILEFLAERDRSLRLPNRAVHTCETCRYLFGSTRVRSLLRRHYRSVEPRVVERFMTSLALADFQRKTILAAQRQEPAG